ncbi:MAG TPA: HlyD family efflux transporter periplasmic adaptor subunit [Allosphingosinicella sp.]
MQLFRPEAMRGQDRLHGEVVLVPPVSWQLLGGFLLAAVVGAIFYFSTAEYKKVTTVRGQLTGSKGVVRAVAPDAGIVEAVLVEEGQIVAAGTPLARISVSTSDGGASLQERRSAAIARRERIMTQREPELAEAFRARSASLRAQIDGDRSEIASIQAQMGEQRDLVRSAVEDLERARTVAARGFVSGRDVRQREEQLGSRRQSLSRLEQELSVRSARIEMAQAELARARTEYDLQLADLADDRAELAGQAAADENALRVVVKAAQAGRVTGLLVHSGDAVGANTPLLSVLPEGTRLQARIEVPAAAAGFIQPGQGVRLAVDAFPYQTYGTIEARVDSVSAATVPVARPDGTSEEVFLVRATLPSGGIRAFDRTQPLRPGMTVTARIATRARSLAEWLFEPLFAVGRR